MNKVRAHIIIEGLVQGVFFRANIRDEAKIVGVNGWVRNNPDGAVEAVLEGDEDSVKKVIRWCRKGPVGARVKDVKISYEEYSGVFNDFTVKYGG